jgi:hypothetical protein
LFHDILKTSYISTNLPCYSISISHLNEIFLRFKFPWCKKNTFCWSRSVVGELVLIRHL